MIVFSQILPYQAISSATPLHSSHRAHLRSRSVLPPGDLPVTNNGYELKRANVLIGTSNILGVRYNGLLMGHAMDDSKYKGCTDP